MRRIAIDARDITCGIRPEIGEVIVLKVFFVFAVALFEVAVAVAEQLHPWEGPQLRCAVVINYDRFEVTVHRFRIGPEHVPRLKETSPQKIRANRFFNKVDYRVVDRDGPANDGDQMENYESV